MRQGEYEAMLEAARLIIAAREADKRRRPKRPLVCGKGSSGCCSALLKPSITRPRAQRKRRREAA